jgi:hypothetical protein
VIIKSMAGEFDISIEGFEVEGRHLVMVGRMGVWDARTYITGTELFTVLGKLLKPSVLLGLITLPFRRVTVEPKPQAEESND